MDSRTTSARPNAARARLACTISVLISAAPATVLLSHAAPAAAGAEVQTRVSYADLDLGRAAGRVALRQRIRLAAHELCGTDEVMLDFKGMRLNERCIAEAIAAAAFQIPAHRAR